MKWMVFVVLVVLADVNHGSKYCMPNNSCWPTGAEIQEFKTNMSATKATVLVPGDPFWPGNYLTFNLAQAKTPGMVVYLGTVDQIRETLKFAYKYNMKISLVSSGHSFFGRSGDEGALQISTHYMKGIFVDLSCQEHKDGCMTAQAGVQWIEAYREADKYNRVVVGGGVGTVSVTGWTIGGGHSPLVRKFGLGVQNVLEFHLITADLSEVWTSASGTKISMINGTVVQNNDTSLFYALRGGGSAFGVIIDLKIKMHLGSKIVIHTCTHDMFEDGSPRPFQVILNTTANIFANAPDNFGGYIVPATGCDQNLDKCGGTSTMLFTHYGGRQDSPDADWFTELDSLPSKLKQQNVTKGVCSSYEFNSFYEFFVLIPNTTYTYQYNENSLIQLASVTSDEYMSAVVEHFNGSLNLKINNSYTATWLGGAVKNATPDMVAVHPGWSGAVFAATTTCGDNPNAPADQRSQWKQNVRDFHNNLKSYSNGKYYNEAALDVSTWSDFWNQQTFDKLNKIKNTWDPEDRFTCRKCLGCDWNGS